MFERAIQTTALFLLGISTSAAADREEEAKRYAGDLKSKDAKVRASAATELGKLGQVQRRTTAPYVSDIIRALNDSDANVRAEAAKALGIIDPDDKKDAIAKLAGILKNEKSETARVGQEMALGELGAVAEDSETKKAARDALLDARQKSDSRREQRTIQTALQLIRGTIKKVD